MTPRKINQPPAPWLERLHANAKAVRGILAVFYSNAKVMRNILVLCAAGAVSLLALKGSLCQLLGPAAELLGSYCSPQQPNAATQPHAAPQSHAATEPHTASTASVSSDICPLTDSETLRNLAVSYFTRYSDEDNCTAKFAFVHPAMIFSLL